MQTSKLDTSGGGRSIKRDTSKGVGSNTSGILSGGRRKQDQSHEHKQHEGQ